MEAIPLVPSLWSLCWFHRITVACQCWVCVMQSLVRRGKERSLGRAESWAVSEVQDPRCSSDLHSLFSVVSALLTHLPGCPGASPRHLSATLLHIPFTALFLLLPLWDLTEAGDCCFSRGVSSPQSVFTYSLYWVTSLNYPQCHPRSRCFLHFCCFTETQAGQPRVLARCFGLTQPELSFYSGPAVSW